MDPLAACRSKRALRGVGKLLQSWELAVPERKIVERLQHQRTETPTAEAGRPARPAEADSALLALAEQLDSLLAELEAVQGLNDELNIKALRRSSRPKPDAGGDCDSRTSQTEAVLARLYPIELTILATPARTINGLAVKARHAAYVMSEYWEAPINQLDWDARTVRLLIEAVCNFAGTPLPFEESRTKVTPVEAGMPAGFPPNSESEQ
jgi:hypothetical protein